MDASIRLQGEHVSIEIVRADHLHELREVGNDPKLWQFTFLDNPFISDESARRWFDAATRDENTRTFVICEKPLDTVVGSTRFYEINEAYRKVEIGYTFVAQSRWRTHVNTETKLLLLQYAFEDWNASRVQFTAEVVNQRSHKAILRIGATHEGTLRSYRVREDGQVRDVNVYSIIMSEWPDVKAKLLGLSRREDRNAQ